MSSSAIAAATPEMIARYEPVIGLEVHVQLATATKIFCGCPTGFGAPPNTNVRPVCLGLPAALAVLSREAVELAIKGALALNCQVRPLSRFARKNYFYPDLPKGYQISQYDQPVAEHGFVDIVEDGLPRRIGTPLIEIVSEPDMRSAAEAHAYLTELKQVMQFIEVSTCDMEKGHLRCDANVSVRLKGTEPFGTRAEVKNLNSFRFLKQAIEFEVARQVAVIESGGRVVQETRLYNPDLDETFSMRSKEDAHDYRYFPEPDLVPLRIGEKWLDQVRASMPELPARKRARFTGEFGLSEYDAEVLTATRATSEYFETVAQVSGNPKMAANWVMGDLMALLKAEGKEIADSPVSAANLGQLVKLIAGDELSGKLAKQVFPKMFSTGEPADVIVEREGLKQISDTGALEKIIEDVIAANPKQVEQYRGGKTTVINFLVGQAMKATRGQANVAVVTDLFKQKLG